MSSNENRPSSVLILLIGFICIIFFVITTVRSFVTTEQINDKWSWNAYGPFYEHRNPLDLTAKVTFEYDVSRQFLNFDTTYECPDSGWRTELVTTPHVRFDNGPWIDIPYTNIERNPEGVSYSNSSISIKANEGFGLKHDIWNRMKAAKVIEFTMPLVQKTIPNPDIDKEIIDPGITVPDRILDPNHTPTCGYSFKVDLDGATAAWQAFDDYTLAEAMADLKSAKEWEDKKAKKAEAKAKKFNF